MSNADCISGLMERWTLREHNFPSSPVFWEALARLADWRTASTFFITREQRTERAEVRATDKRGRTWQLFYRFYRIDPTSTKKRPASWARRSTRRKGLQDGGQPDLVREIIAKRIIEAAEKGERDPVRLRDAGLAALGYGREAI